MQHWFFLILILAFQVPNVYAYDSNQAIAECHSKDVWDAGYVLRFDVSAHAGDGTAQIPSEVFQLVPLWKRQLEFSGPLMVVALPSPQACEVLLMDRPDAPTVALSFKISASEQDIELLELHGERPQKFTKLECQPAVIDRLTRDCLAAQ